MDRGIIILLYAAINSLSAAQNVIHIRSLKIVYMFEYQIKLMKKLKTCPNIP